MEVKGNMDHHMRDFFRSAEDNKDIILEMDFKKKKSFLIIKTANILAGLGEKRRCINTD